jgi:hypothetical protein
VGHARGIDLDQAVSFFAKTCFGAFYTHMQQLGTGRERSEGLFEIILMYEILTPEELAYIERKVPALHQQH